MFAKPECDNVCVRRWRWLRGSGCNTLSHSGLANVNIRKRMFYPLIKLRNHQNQTTPICQSFKWSNFGAMNIKWASTQENLSSGVCERQRRRPACASLQSDQRLCYSLFRKYHIKACYKRNFNVLASPCC